MSDWYSALKIRAEMFAELLKAANQGESITRASNCLANSEYAPEDIPDLSDKELLRLPNMGLVTLKQIRRTWPSPGDSQHKVMYHPTMGFNIIRRLAEEHHAKIDGKEICFPTDTAKAKFLLSYKRLTKGL